MSVCTKETGNRRYRIGDNSEFYWEVIDSQTNQVVEYIPRHEDDENRNEAVEAVKLLNAMTRKAKLP